MKFHPIGLLFLFQMHKGVYVRLQDLSSSTFTESLVFFFDLPCTFQFMTLRKMYLYMYEN